MSARPPLFTVGHGNADQDHLTGLLSDAGIEQVVDVRRWPSSRRHPHASRAALASWLPAAGIAYRWEERLGGRRDGTPGSVHTALRADAFRPYADHLGSEEFLAAIDRLLDDAAATRVAVMCAESSWRRCHRQFIADHVVLLAGVPVTHLGHDGATENHVRTEVVRVEDGRLVYDGGAPTLDLDGR